MQTELTQIHRKLTNNDTIGSKNNTERSSYLHMALVEINSISLRKYLSQLSLVNGLKYLHRMNEKPSNQFDARSLPNQFVLLHSNKFKLHFRVASLSELIQIVYVVHPSIGHTNTLQSHWFTKQEIEKNNGKFN